MYCMWEGCWESFGSMFGVQWMGPQVVLRYEGFDQLARVENTFVCKICIGKRAGDGEDK